MGRGGRGGGLGGGLGRSGGGSRLGAGRSTLGGGSLGRGGARSAPRAPAPSILPRVAPRAPAAPRPRSGLGSGAVGFGLGLGAGMAMGGGRRRRAGWGMGGMGMGWGPRRRRHMGMGGMGMGPRGGGGCGGSGCGTLLIVIFALILVVMIISFVADFASPNNWGQATPVTPVESTIIREPLPSGSRSRATGPMFTDNIGWIQNATAMEVGLRNFFQATGVRPHVYLVEEIFGTAYPTNAQVGEFADALYPQLFADEAHLLLVFFENYLEQYAMQLVLGNAVHTVMDPQAQDILLNQLQTLYYDAGLTEEAFFSNSFDRASQIIMSRPPDNRSVWITLIIVAGVLLLVSIAFRWWRKNQEQKRLEAEETERILSQPLEEMGAGNDAASQLAASYEDGSPPQDSAQNPPNNS